MNQLDSVSELDELLLQGMVSEGTVRHVLNESSSKDLGDSRCRNQEYV